MNEDKTEIRFKGKTLKVPGLTVGTSTVVVKGGWLKIAEIKDDDVMEDPGVSDPTLIIAKLRENRVRADIFTFSQKIPDTEPRFNLPIQWDNAAAIRLATYNDWWEGLSQESRRNVRLAAKRGVVTKAVPFDDALVRGIHGIYNETPIRQGTRFWHYGKTIETVKDELSTYLDRSEFIGAYWEDKLIGFIKMVYVGKVARIFHILSCEEHQDKRPTNALIAKAVEICAQKGIEYFIYCKYVYGNNTSSPLTEFKRRNGFHKVDLPRYYIPLTLKGRLILKFRIHLGLVGMLPSSVITMMVNLRSRFARFRSFRARVPTTGGAIENEKPTVG